MLCLLSNYLLQSYKNFPFKLCWSKPWYMRERNGIADRNCTCMDYIRLLRREVPYLFGSQRHIEIEKVQGKIERSIVGSWTPVINYQLIFLSVRSNSNRYHWTHLEIFLKGFWNWWTRQDLNLRCKLLPCKGSGFDHSHHWPIWNGKSEKIWKKNLFLIINFKLIRSILSHYYRQKMRFSYVTSSWKSIHPLCLTSLQQHRLPRLGH